MVITMIEIIRKKQLEHFKTILQGSSEALYYWGISGCGKSILRKQMEEYCEEHFPTYVHTVCDFQHIHNKNTIGILNLLHQLADTFDADKLNVKGFDLIDNVFCKRNKQLSRLEGKQPKHDISMIENATDMFEALSDIPYFGLMISGTKIAKEIYELTTQKLGKTAKDIKKFKGYTDEELLKEMPITLCNDIFENKSNPNHLVVFLENVHLLTPENQQCLNALINEKRNIFWVLFSQEKVSTELYDSVNTIYLEGFTLEEKREFLQNEFRNEKEALIPFLLEKVHIQTPALLETTCRTIHNYIKDHGTFTLEEIEEQIKSSKQMVTQIFGKLDSRKQDIIIILGVARYIDENCFEALYPSYHFFQYRTWFEDFMFTQENERIALQGFFRKLLDVAGHPELFLSCNKKLIHCYEKQLDRLLQVGTVNLQLFSRYLEDLFYHCKQMGADRKESMQMLSKYRRYALTHHVQAILTQSYTEILENSHPYSHMGLLCRLNLIQLYMMEGDYQKVPLYMPSIEELETLRRDGENELLLSFLSCVMQYQHLFPEGDFSETDHKPMTIWAGELSLLLLESANCSTFSPKKQKELQMELHTFLGKQYFNRNQNKEAEKHLRCAVNFSPKMIQLFALYRSFAFAQVHLGEFLNGCNCVEEAYLVLTQALENFEYAVLLEEENYGLMLDFALAHKRMAENRMLVQDIVGVLYHVDLSLELCQNVCDRIPQYIEVYPKIGYANLDIGSWLLSQGEIEKATIYIENGIVAGKKALEQFVNNFEETDFLGNRQIQNLLSKGYRLQARVKPSLNKSLLKESLLHAENSISLAPLDQLGYKQYLQSVLLLTPLMDQNDSNDAAIKKKAISYGIVIMEHFSNNVEVVRIYQELKSLFH